MSVRALVTGGAGFIGRHLVDELVSRGWGVVVLDNLEPRAHGVSGDAKLPPEVRFVRGDVRDKTAWENALLGVQVVFHQAAYQDYMSDYSKFFHTNVVGTALMFEVIRERKLGVEKIVVASSQAVYGEGQYDCLEHGLVLASARTRAQMLAGDWEVHCPQCRRSLRPRKLEEEFPNPFNQYALSKYSQEMTALRLGRLFDLPSVALRYSITQGPRQSLFNQYSGVCRIFFSRAMRNEPLIVYEDGHQTRDFVHVQDVVDANMLVLEKDEADFQAFNVGSGTPTAVLEYAEAVRSKLNSEAPIEIPGEYRRGDNRHSVSNIEKLKQLGWKPRRSLPDILDDFLAWVEEIGGIPTDIPDAYADMRRAGVVLRAENWPSGCRVSGS